MSTTFSEAAAFVAPRPAAPDARRHQSDSWWRPRAARRLIRLWTARQGQRAALAELLDNEHLLADVGLTRAQALRETAKPFWRS